MAKDDYEAFLVIGVFSGVMPTFVFIAGFLVVDGLREGWAYWRSVVGPLCVKWWVG